jgi:hypothetical protein
MRSQLKNDRILSVYFLSSLVGYDAKLTARTWIVIIPQNILSKIISVLRDTSPVNRGTLSNWQK